MSRKIKVAKEVAVYKAHCIARVVPEPSPHEHACEHAPDGNMVWGEPPEAFCKQCIHYQYGHNEGHEEEEE